MEPGCAGDGWAPACMGSGKEFLVLPIKLSLPQPTSFLTFPVLSPFHWGGASGSVGLSCQLGLNCGSFPLFLRSTWVSFPVAWALMRIGSDFLSKRLSQFYPVISWRKPWGCLRQKKRCWQWAHYRAVCIVFHTYQQNLRICRWLSLISMSVFFKGLLCLNWILTLLVKKYSRTMTYSGVYVGNFEKLLGLSWVVYFIFSNFMKRKILLAVKCLFSECAALNEMDIITPCF